MEESEKIAHKIEEKERTLDVKVQQEVPFSKMNISDCVRKGLSRAGFVYPTNIQAKSIPLGKAGIDLLIQSKSGTGKTLIFSVILLEAYKVDIREPQSLILAPTREIAIQIEMNLNSIGKCCQGFKAVSVIGGLDVVEDRRKIQGAKAIVGTPGRVLHLIKNDVLNTSKIRLIILDEADELVNQMLRDVEKIINNLPTKKQLIACSATFCDDLDEKLVKYMRNPLLISIEKRATLLIGIKQFVYELQEVNTCMEMASKVKILNKIFSKISFKQCLVFASSQSRAETYRNLIAKNGWPCEEITGAQDQKKRLEIFKKFREFKIRILISTDLMSRGIDSENVNLVINLEVPESSTTYLHRIGRAGRFGSHGIAVTLLCSYKDRKKFSQIIDNIGDNMTVLKFPIHESPDFWDFSNLSEEQKTFGLFEKVDCIKESKVQDVKAIEENGENLNITRTDSPSSSSCKQHSVNATTLDDASSLAVDSDNHLDVIKANIYEKKSPYKRSAKFNERKNKLQDCCCETEYFVEIQIEQDCQQGKTLRNKQKSDKTRQNHLRKNAEMAQVSKSYINSEDHNGETQSDLANSSGGDTRTIIDFKSLVVDKEKVKLKSTSNDIFVDYEAFDGVHSENTNQSVEVGSMPDDIFDDYEHSSKDQPEKEKITELSPNIQLSNPSSELVSQIDKSTASENLPKAPNPSPKDLPYPEFSRNLDSHENNDCQFDMRKLQIQQLPAFNLPPRDNHPELETTSDDDNDDDDDDDEYTIDSQSTFSNTISSGFDEKSTILSSSGIVTSTDYTETDEDSSYSQFDSDGEEEEEEDDDGDDECEISEENEEDSGSRIDPMDQYSIASDQSKSDINQNENDGDKNDNVKNIKSNLYKGDEIQNSSSSKVNDDTVIISNLNDANYRYQYAYSMWTNIYWDQITQIRDYVNFSSYVKRSV